MAETKKAEKEELNLDEKVIVRSIANWLTGFSRIESFGDVSISPRGTVRLSRNEIISQSQSGNKLFNGIDGIGSHATLIIEDEATRKELDFDSVDGKRKQAVFSEELIKKLFDLKTKAAFESNFKDAIKTSAEMQATIDTIKKLGLNDYNKIRFIEEYTGYKVQ